MKEVIAKVSQGKLPRYVSEHIRTILSDKGEGTIKITIEDYKAGRTNQQNRYYWKVLVGGIKAHMAASGAPVSADAIHFYIKTKLCRDLCEWGDDCEVFGVSFFHKTYTTTNLSTEYFEQMCERIRAWAAENGLQLPLPNEYISD